MPNTLYGRKPLDEEDLPEGPQMAGQIQSPGMGPGKEEEQQPEIIAIADIDRAIDNDLRPQRVIDEKAIHEAYAILQKYKSGKANLEKRAQEDEEWWKLRHWDVFKNKGSNASTDITPKPTSGWLMNSLVNKHADAMDNYPEPIVLPRERSDEESSKVLSSVLPVIMEYNDFERTYDLNWWEKLKHGTAIYGVFWDNKKENGLGDVSVKMIDVMKIFWEPGITDIQDSRNLFIVELVDEDLMDDMYPEHAGKMHGGAADITEYLYDDDVDTSKKSLVVDWYYKVADASGKTILHYCKFCGGEVLYASENDPLYAERGFYDHGKYPVVFDVLFPEKGTPAGFGYIAVGKDEQMYIDQLDANIMQTSMMETKKRFFISNSSAINEDEFLDWNNPFVHVEGELGDERIKEIVVQPMSALYTNIKQMKIDEMKDTTSNRDVNNGGGSGSNNGVTAASAIAALQESGNKVSRSIINTTYKAYADICKLVIELIRQFYDETRAFRVVGANEGDYRFIDMNNAGIREQVAGFDAMGNALFRMPVFDLKVKAQKRNPFSTMEANARAQELYGLGFFNPDRAQEAMGALEMMEFEGIDKVRDTVRQGQTLQNIVLQLMQQNQQMMSLITGQPMGQGTVQQQSGSSSPAPQAPSAGKSVNSGSSADTLGGQALRANTPMTSYGQRLAARSKPNMNTTSSAATPK